MVHGKGSHRNILESSFRWKPRLMSVPKYSHKLCVKKTIYVKRHRIWLGSDTLQWWRFNKGKQKLLLAFQVTSYRCLHLHGSIFFQVVASVVHWQPHLRRFRPQTTPACGRQSFVSCNQFCIHIIFYLSPSRPRSLSAPLPVVAGNYSIC